MKLNDNLLWQVLRAYTNSPNDVWKHSHYQRHKGKPKQLLGDNVRRYTVPIKEVCKIIDDEIYLVAQFSTSAMEFPYFVIDKKAFTKDLEAEEEFIYAINVRLCFKSEFIIRHRKQLDWRGEVKREYREDILNSAINLIREKPRHRIMKIMTDTERIKNMTRKELWDVIKISQFDELEKEYKGLDKTDSDIDNP